MYFLTMFSIPGVYQGRDWQDLRGQERSQAEGEGAGLLGENGVSLLSCISGADLFLFLESSGPNSVRA